MHIERPYLAMIEITPGCNLCCTHCYGVERFGINPPEKANNSETFRKVLEKLHEYEIMGFVLTGGEPLVRRDLLFQALESAKQNNVITHLNTNATLINEGDCNEFARNGLNASLVSLISRVPEKHDAITQIVGSQERTVKGISLLRQFNIPVNVNMVVSRLNLDDVVKTGLFMKEIGVRSFSATPIQPAGNQQNNLLLSRDQIRRLCDNLDYLRDNGINSSMLEPLPFCIFDEPEKYERFLRRSCGAGTIDIYVTASGDVSACAHEPLPVGNILVDTYPELMRRMNGYRMQRGVRQTDGKEADQSSFTPETCYSCAELESCRGSCRVEALYVSGDIRASHPYARRQLKDKIKRPNISQEQIDFVRSEKSFSDLLGFEFGSIRFRREPSGNYLLMTPKRKVLSVSPDSFYFYKTVMLEVKVPAELDRLSARFDGGERFINNMLNYLLG